MIFLVFLAMFIVDVRNECELDRQRSFDEGHKQGWNESWGQCCEQYERTIGQIQSEHTLEKVDIKQRTDARIRQLENDAKTAQRIHGENEYIRGYQQGIVDFHIRPQKPNGGGFAPLPLHFHDAMQKVKELRIAQKPRRRKKCQHDKVCPDK